MLRELISKSQASLPSNEQLEPVVEVPRLTMVNLSGVALYSSPGFVKALRSASLTAVNLSVAEEETWVPAEVSLKYTTQVESVTSPSTVNVPLPSPPSWARANG